MPAGFWIGFYPCESLVQDLEGGIAAEAIIAPAGRFMGFNRWAYVKSCQELPSVLLCVNHLKSACSGATGGRGL
jgi:hypothetical protein